MEQRSPENLGNNANFGVIDTNDGLVLVQAEDSAEYDGMPRSAIHSGVVDMVLTPTQIPPKLVRYFSHRAIAKGPQMLPATDTNDWLNKIFAVVRVQIGHDFSQYKRNTLLRRISRRMGLNHIDEHEVYVRYLRQKLESEDEPRLLHTVRGMGYVLREPD